MTESRRIACWPPDVYMNPVRTKIELLLLVVFIGQTALLGYLLGVEFINNLNEAKNILDQTVKKLQNSKKLLKN